MATIALYANKINQMPGLVKDVKQSVIDYKSELATLQKKTLTINKSICDLEDVMSSIQTSSQIQEQKIDSLDVFSENNKEFISAVARTDSDVAAIINQRKDDFYEEYYYLKPECEKNWKEKTRDWFASAGEWCKEHWKAVVTIVLVVAAIAIIIFCPAAAAPLLMAIAKNVLLGAVIGGFAGGIINSVFFGSSFWEGFENGAFMGVIGGIISGGMGFAFTGGKEFVTLTLKQVLSIGGVSGMGSQLISDLGDIYINGADISLGQMILNIGISGVLGVAFAGIGYGFSKAFSALKLKFSGGTQNNKNSLFARNLDSVLKKNNISLDDFNSLRLKNVSSLSDTEIALLKSIRESLPMPDNTTTLQKVIPASDINKYIDGTYTQVGGFITRLDDVAQLSNYDDIYNSLRLDYPDTAYNLASDNSLAIIKYTTDDTAKISIPFSSEFGGTTTGEQPFTGNGFTKANNGQIIPEYKCTGRLDINDGAQLIEIGKDGTQILRAIYSELHGQFIEVK